MSTAARYNWTLMHASSRCIMAPHYYVSTMGRQTVRVARLCRSAMHALTCYRGRGSPWM